MTRLPREGRNKTRLIPALGEGGAAAFHDRLARHAIGRASSYVMMHPDTHLRVHIEGGTASDGRDWLGDVDCIVQRSGDLGDRMRSAVDLAFSDGAKRVVVIGTDCPSLDESLLAGAFDSLDRADLVFGPATDGGYYLVGLTKPCAGLFTGIDWGGARVLNQSLAAARSAGLHAELLEALSDVDTPDDLEHARDELAAAGTVSVIVPTLNEEAVLGSLLESLMLSPPHEIIVADGGSNDRTVTIANEAGVRVVPATRGRASQMNLAASAATGEFLLFLHADTQPPPDYPQVIGEVLQKSATSAGAFRFKLDGCFRGSALVESLVNLRCRLVGTPYGDQGLFVRRRLFQHLGGFPDWPLLEDLDLVRSLKRRGAVCISPLAARTSGRRWREGGPVRTFLRHQVILAAYYLGVPPRCIARLRS